MADFDRTPGVPAKLGHMHWVSAAEFAGEHGYRPVDPAPLARLLYAVLDESSDAWDQGQALVTDDRDGPIHIVHLLAACEHAAQAVGGHVRIGQEKLLKALLSKGFPAATAVVRAMPTAERMSLLGSLIETSNSVITTLSTDLTEHHFRHKSFDGDGG